MKGKTQPVRVFALVGDEKVALLPEFLALRDALDAMLRHYRARQFDVALDDVRSLRRASGVDLAILMDLYDLRIRNLLRNSPPPDWDGSAIAESK